MTSAPATPATTPAVTVTDHEAQQIARSNATGLQPIVFVHGLWLLPSSWDRWAAFFEEAGFTALTPGWPDDPSTVDEANANPDVFANKTIGQVADHVEQIVRGLQRKPAIIGHSFGGLLAQILAGRGLSRATVAIDPAPFRGVLPLPLSALRSSFPVLGNPANRHRAVPLTYEQFRFAFANAVSEEEAKQLYEEFAVPAPGAPLFQAATANLSINGVGGWFLPSRDELVLMYRNLKAAGIGEFRDAGVVDNFTYWASSQQTADMAAHVDFADLGRLHGDDKDFPRRVRAVRSI